MVGKIVEHSQPVRGVKISSRIKRKWLRTVLELKIALLSIGGSKGGHQGRAPPPWGSKFFHFHAVFGKKLKNNSTFGSWPPPGKILDPPLLMAINKRSIKWKSIYLFYTFCFNQFIKFVSVGYSRSVRADISKYRSFLNPLQRCLEVTSLILIRNYLRTITCAITYTRNCLIRHGEPLHY